MIAPARILTAMLAAALLLLPACREEAAAPEVEGPRLVKTVTVAYTVVNSPGSLVGEVAPQIESDLGFRVGGKLAQRLVDVGDVVTAGEVLARLDIAQAQNSVRQAEASLAAATAQRENAEQTEKRTSDLLGRGFATQAAADAATAQANVARANELAAQASVSDARDGLGYTDLVAPEAGVVMSRGAEVGQVVAAGQMIVELARTDLKDAQFQAPGAVLGSGAENAPVTVTLLDDPSIVAHGRVREISPAADPVTRTFRVRVRIDDAPAAFRFGSAVRGMLELPGPKAAALPLSALFNTADRPAVWVVDANGVVELTPVEVLRYEGERILISGGLEEGAKVVAAGVQRLRPGMQVRLPAGDA
ncbi:efflux RND transporter periplasmic adaptor subunit [Haematobacter genomosp. 1]|uniref:Efflux transporter periplasmic adaptor subunit n=1 Tax=Haematobacter genomosp. 1 TaxID=366618 RepID=A0A212A6H3_9RHOB|nr:efflux RND transporter periplasmic adaptor subunit [Haematobacter genomosp. 1]OWJ74386.1 efflux transporter periplasmic adaptor subunit [Haematobacter genomosp. 1]